MTDSKRQVIEDSPAMKAALEAGSNRFDELSSYDDAVPEAIRAAIAVYSHFHNPQPVVSAGEVLSSMKSACTLCLAKYSAGEITFEELVRSINAISRPDSARAGQDAVTLADLQPIREALGTIRWQLEKSLRRTPSAQRETSPAIYVTAALNHLTAIEARVAKDGGGG
jgi:hypothetical protein